MLSWNMNSKCAWHGGTAWSDTNIQITADQSMFQIYLNKD